MKKFPIELNTSVYYYDSIVKKIYHFILTNYFIRKEKTFLVFTTPEDLKKVCHTSIYILQKNLIFQVFQITKTFAKLTQILKL